MDTEFGEFFYPGSLVEFHAAADVFARRYNEKGRYMSCEVVAPGAESGNLPSSAYMARFVFAIKDRELSLYVHAFFFVDAIQVSEGRTYLKIDSSVPRHMDGSSLVDLDLVWLDLLIHLHVVKDFAHQRVEQSQEIEPPVQPSPPPKEVTSVATEITPEEDQREQPAQQVTTDKQKTNPGVKAHADAIDRLDAGQDKQANYYQWRNEYQAECGDFTSKKSSENELYRKSVWSPYRKKLIGKI